MRLRPRGTWYVLVLILLASRRAFADSTATKARTITRLADGIYTIRHPDAPDTFPQSNTTVIIGEKSVLVVDSGLLPSAAREDVAQIRTWTNKPVTYLLNTHWHFDHTLGNATYAEAFPAVQIVAQRATQKTIADYNPGVVLRYPSRAERFRKILETGKNPDGRPLSEGERKDYERSLAGLAPVVAEFKTATQLPPNVAFDRELLIDLGNRPVEIRFLGRGNTAGDAIVYLPREKILMTGDLVVHPVPYLFGGFPLDHVQTLRAMAELDATTIVPGHGEILRDKAYIFQVADLLKAVNTAMEAEVNAGKTLEEVQGSFPKTFDVKTWRTRFAGDSVEDGEFFDGTFDGLIKASYNQIKTR
jgi:glyoxylase-like metal-dependent hydrolase (beta-lactamase superfamily II)